MKATRTFRFAAVAVSGLSSPSGVWAFRVPPAWQTDMTLTEYASVMSQAKTGADFGVLQNEACSGGLCNRIDHLGEIAR